MPTTRSCHEKVNGDSTARPRRVLGSLDNCSSPLRPLTPEKLLSPEPKKSRRPKKAESCKETPVRLVGREEELSRIEEFITTCVNKGNSGSMYISGAPGTGKTAVIRQVCNERLSGTNRAFYVNCMRVSDPVALAEAILREVANKSEWRECSLETVEQFLSTRSEKRPLVLVLDEIDALAHSHLETLYRLFDWPGVLPCRLVLLCIANSLDLTDRLLPRLKGRTWRPVLLHFRPYSHEQLARIVESKVDSPQSPIDRMAVQLCARKVAASSGDARAAIDICRRSVQMAGSSPAGLSHVSRTMSSRPPDGLPLQHKLALAAALLIQRREFSLGLFHDRYQELCRERQLAGVDAAEFAALCQLLEARGLILVRKAKETRMRKVSVKLDEKSVRQCIDDPALISSVMASRDREERMKAARE